MKGVWFCLILALPLPGIQISHAQTWTLQASNTGADLSAVAILSASDMVAVGDKAGITFVIRYTSNGGVTWNAPSAPGAPANNLNAVNFSGNTVIAVGKGGTIARSTDRGASFTFPVSPTAKELKALAFITSSIVVATGVKTANDYTLIRSADGGATWGNATTPANQGVDLNALAFNGATAIAVGQKSGVNFKILRSTDSGANWSNPASLPGGGQNLNAVAFINPTTVVAVGDNGTILTSTDGGDNWAAEVSSTGQNLSAVVAFGTIVVAIGQRNGANFTVLRSTDNGNNWSAATTPAGTGEHLNAVDASSSLMIAVGDNGAILTSTDSGGAWVSEVSNTLGNLFGVAIFNPVIVVGQNGLILSRTASSTTAGSGSNSLGIGSGIVVPFGGEWSLLLLVLGLGLYQLRRFG